MRRVMGNDAEGGPASPAGPSQPWWGSCFLKETSQWYWKQLDSFKERNVMMSFFSRIHKDPMWRIDHGVKGDIEGQFRECLTSLEV